VRSFELEIEHWRFEISSGSVEPANHGYVGCQLLIRERSFLKPPQSEGARLQNDFRKTIPKRRILAENRAVKVERSRARGRVASNTLTARFGAIPCACWNCFQLITPPPLIRVHILGLSYPAWEQLPFWG
jgi:hypothetical protein